MKRLLAISVVALVLGGCSSAASAAILRAVENTTANDAQTITKQITLLPAKPKTLTLLAQQEQDRLSLLEQHAALAELRNANAIKMDRVVAQLKKQVGKTWYVFSGHTPQGWDCSGLVYWAYGQLGVSLDHSATAEANSGVKVTNPKVGDVVAFAWEGSKNYYHAAIYIGDNKVIHAGFRPGTQTSIIDLDSPAFKNTRIDFIRILDRT